MTFLSTYTYFSIPVLNLCVSILRLYRGLLSGGSPQKQPWVNHRPWSTQKKQSIDDRSSECQLSLLPSSLESNHMIFRTCHCTISDCTKHALSPVLPLRTAHPNYRWPLPGNSICRNTACQLQHIHPDTSPWASSANKKSIEQQWRIWEPLRLSWVSIAWLDGHGRIFKGTLLTSDKWVIQWFISIETFWRGDEGYAVG